MGDVAFSFSERDRQLGIRPVVVRKKRRHVELAGLQVISAAPAVHRPGLVVLDVGVPRKADEEISVLRPINAQPVIPIHSRTDAR
jgi:hypothetical protein